MSERSSIDAAAELAALAATLEEERSLLRDVAEAGGDRRLGGVARRLGETARRLAAAAAAPPADREARLGELLRRLADLDAGLDLGGFCRRLLDHLTAAVGAAAGYVLLGAPSLREAQLVAARNLVSDNLTAPEHRLSRTVARHVLETARPLRVDDARRSPFADAASVRRLGLASILAVPVPRGDAAVGVLYLESPRVAAFDAADQALAEAVAAVAAVWLRHARLAPEPPADPRFILELGGLSDVVVGRDPGLLRVLDLARRAAPSAATLLLQGESGVGKDLLAKAIHAASPRREGPFVAVNCAALPESLVESELFGHERGAFTGAGELYRGRIEQARGGTLYLDEIGELPATLQPKLLRFLHDGRVARLGGRDEVPVDARVVAATSRDLEAMVADGRFLPALYFRLHVVPLTLPPLRDRPADVPLLVEHFARRYEALYGRRVELCEEALALLCRHPFPGNVRELENVVHRLVVTAPETRVRLGDLPPEMLGAPGRAIDLVATAEEAAPAADLGDLARREADARRRFAADRRRLVQAAVDAAGGSVSEAARRLGLHRVTVHKLLRRP